jgi:lipopolysaccharide transport system permease protein
MSRWQLVRDYSKEVVYTPTSGLGFGLTVWAEMVRQLILGRELIWRLLLRDLSARYRQSVLGYIWAVVPALGTVIMFTYIYDAKLLPIGKTDIPYPAYVLLGMTVWQLFANGITATTQSLVGAGPLLSRVQFLREALVLAAYGQSVLDFLIRLALVGIVFVWFHVVPAWTVFLVPFLLVPLMLLTLGLGFLLALANGVIRDVGNAVVLLVTYGMFLTPIVYPPPTEWPQVLVNYLNPVSPYIIATHDLTTKGTLSQPELLAWSCAASVVVFLIGWRVFHLAMPRIAERM